MNKRKPGRPAGRPAATSAELLRRILAEREAELAQYREIVFAIVRHQGRVRVPRAAFDQAKVGDCLEARPDGDHVVLEFGRGDAAPKPVLVPDEKPVPALVTAGGRPMRAPGERP